MISKRSLFVGVIVTMGAFIGPYLGDEIPFWVLPLLLCFISVFIMKYRPVKTGLITGFVIAIIAILVSVFVGKEDLSNIDFYFGSLVMVVVAILEGLFAGVIYWLIARARGWETQNELEWLTRGENVWSFGWVILFSILGGMGAGYLICWQDLIRMGKQETAKKFLLWGGVTLLAIHLVLFLLSDQLANKSLSTGLSLMFPTYLYYAHLKEWQKNNPGIAGFEKKIVLWAILGLILSLLIIFVFASFFK